MYKEVKERVGRKRKGMARGNQTIDVEGRKGK